MSDEKTTWTDRMVMAGIHAVAKVNLGVMPPEVGGNIVAAAATALAAYNLLSQEQRVQLKAEAKRIANEWFDAAQGESTPGDA